MKKCLFCPRPIDSAEHVWSDWILQDLKPTKPIHVAIGRRVRTVMKNAAVRVNCVCQQCNNTWMSDLENENKPHIRSMMRDCPTSLEPKQQRSLARWAILKAMVVEQQAKRDMIKVFFTESERTEIAPPSPFLPVITFVWIGRLSISSFHAGNMHSYGGLHGIRCHHCCVTTIIVGHLIIQVFNWHLPSMFATQRTRPTPKPGPWQSNLLEVWPVVGEVRWPPPLSFTAEGADGVAALVDRWKIGTDIGGMVG